MRSLISFHYFSFFFPFFTFFLKRHNDILIYLFIFESVTIYRLKSELLRSTQLKNSKYLNLKLSIHIGIFEIEKTKEKREREWERENLFYFIKKILMNRISNIYSSIEYFLLIRTFHFILFFLNIIKTNRTNITHTNISVSQTSVICRKREIFNMAPIERDF